MDPSVEFTALDLHHATAIADYVADFANAGEQEIHGYFVKPEWGHALTVEKLDAWSRGRDLGDFVPSTTRFLISQGRILGNYNFRHSLTDALMVYGGHCGYSVRPSERRKGYATLMLGHAKKLGQQLGMDRLMLTCNPDNIGSSRTIERNGGVLKDSAYNEELDCHIARYLIDLS